MTYYYSKVVGVTFDDRQRIIRKLKAGDPLYFERDPNNPYDRNAVKVMTASNDHIGFVAKEQSERVSMNIKNGMRYSVRIESITGGGIGSYYGVNIRVEDM